MSDAGMEDMLCEIDSVGRFAGLRLTGLISDETTMLDFRQQSERHGLGGWTLRGVRDPVVATGFSLKHLARRVSDLGDEVAELDRIIVPLVEEIPPHCSGSKAWGSPTRPS